MDYDLCYKRLFSEPDMVAHLLRGFVPEDWVGRVDFQTLERALNETTGRRAKRRRDDLVWRIRLRGPDGTAAEWVYIYLLLEFQSRPDWRMPLRILNYECMVVQELARSLKLTAKDKLPHVVPLVLYNGGGRWRGPQEVADLFAHVPGLEPFVPRLRFLLFDEQRTATAAGLAQRNFVAALFALEKSRAPEDIRRLVGLLHEWLAEPEFASLRRAFVLWLTEAMAARGLTRHDIPETEDLMEAHAMLKDRVREWIDESFAKGKAEGEAEGEAKGVAKGEAKGEAKGKASLILRLLRLRFGTVPDAVAARVAAETDPDRLDAWFDRVVAAESPEAIFRG